MAERETVEALAEVLHHQHAEEFPFLNGDDLADPVPADQCGNCQRWARYAAAAVETARREGAETALRPVLALADEWEESWREKGSRFSGVFVADALRAALVEPATEEADRG